MKSPFSQACCSRDVFLEFQVFPGLVQCHQRPRCPGGRGQGHSLQMDRRDRELFREIAPPGKKKNTRTVQRASNTNYTADRITHFYRHTQKLDGRTWFMADSDTAL